jgi:transcriptional regulator with XRE-family HTH domain
MQVKELTSSQLVAARSVLGWSINELADRTGIGSATIKRYEAADGIPKSRKGLLFLLRTHFESAGIEFIGTPDDGPGIRIYSTSSDPSST